MNIRLKRLFYIISLCGIAVTLTACSEDDLDFSTLGNSIDSSTPTFTTQQLTNDNVDYTNDLDIPITITYFNLLMELIDKISEYNDAGRELTRSTQLTDVEKREKRIELAQDILVYLNAFRYSPTSDVEQEIHNYTIKVIVSLETLAEYRIKYNRGDDSYRQLILDAEQHSKDDTQIWVKIMDKYNLFLE